jgi:hypothetical protein
MEPGVLAGDGAGGARAICIMPRPELVAVDRDGRESWRRAVETATALAVGRDGTSVLAGPLQRFGPDGTLVWGGRGGTDAAARPILDSENVVYVRAESKADGVGVVALGQESEVLFSVDGPLKPLAIDGRGRLLALEESSKPHLVAIV